MGLELVLLVSDAGLQKDQVRKNSELESKYESTRADISRPGVLHRMREQVRAGNT